MYVSGRPFTSVSSVCRLPCRRADLPRSSSHESGFFFCGISDEPVQNVSGSDTKKNSELDHRIRSSAMREKCTPASAQAEANSMNTSRSATVSMEFWVTRGLPCASTKPSVLAVNSRSMGSVVPAMAPAPSGHQLA